MKSLLEMIKTFSNGWTSYWFQPAPLGDLAVSRIMIVGFQLFFLISQNWTAKLRTLSSLPDGLYDPLPILHLLVSPFGWTFRPPIGALETVFWLTLVSGIFALVGLRTKLSLVLFALGSGFMHAYVYSYQDFHHPPGIMVIGLTVLALSPAGKLISIDHLLASKFKQTTVVEEYDAFARWPLLVVQWVFALAYFSAAKSKLFAGGLDWMNGYTLQHALFIAATRHHLALGIWLSQHHTLALLLSWFTMFIEATFFVVLIFPVLVWLYIPMGIMLHAGMYLTMGANFFQWIALYTVFIPWTSVVNLLKRQFRFASAFQLKANDFPKTSSQVLVTGDWNE